MSARSPDVRIRHVRAITAVIVVVLCLVLSGCDDASRNKSDADDRPVTFRGTITAGSMEPTLMPGDKIIATEVDPSGPVVGDVVVYMNPGDWLGGEEGEGQLVHRVIGAPGDTVVCCDPDGRISVNGSLIDEPYLAPDRSSCDAPISKAQRSAALHSGARVTGRLARCPMESCSSWATTGPSPPTRGCTCAHQVRTPVSEALGCRST